MSVVLTGGCQCGAVRYRVAGPLRRASICNCRMCQKALGNLFGALRRVRRRTSSGRAGSRSISAVPTRVQRGFCANCGTPLTYQCGENGDPALTIGSFDHPNELVPTVELARDNRHPIFGARRRADLGAHRARRTRSAIMLAILRSLPAPRSGYRQLDAGRRAMNDLPLGEFFGRLPVRRGALSRHARCARTRHVCYCRMCQKATGNLFAALVGVGHENLTWTRGRPADVPQLRAGRARLLRRLRNVALLSPSSTARTCR